MPGHEDISEPAGRESCAVGARPTRHARRCVRPPERCRPRRIPPHTTHDHREPPVLLLVGSGRGPVGSCASSHAARAVRTSAAQLQFKRMPAMRERSYRSRGSIKVVTRTPSDCVAASARRRRRRARLRRSGRREIELAPVIGERARRARAHSITRSARSKSDGGIVRPSAFAVFRLITSSNFVGRSTGRSAGFAPLRILSK